MVLKIIKKLPKILGQTLTFAWFAFLFSLGFRFVNAFFLRWDVPVTNTLLFAIIAFPVIRLLIVAFDTQKESERQNWQHVTDTLAKAQESALAGDIKERIDGIRGLLNKYTLQQLKNKRYDKSTSLGNLRHMLLNNMPTAINNYLELPQDYAESHILANGTTAKDDLLQKLQSVENNLKYWVQTGYQQEIVQNQQQWQQFSSQTLAQNAASPNVAPEIQDRLDKITEKVNRAALAPEIRQKVASIRTNILALLPKLMRQNNASHNSYNLKQTALEYLPDAINKYLEFPQYFAEHHILSNGKTPQQILLEQLDLLDSTVYNMMSSIYENDSDGLLVHGNFLADKFANHKIDLS